MVDGAEGEEDLNVRYWKTKYDLLHEDYRRTKDRTEDLENRLLEIIEESDRKDHEKDEKIRQLETQLEKANGRVEQLEATCFRYKTQQGKVTAPTVKNDEKPAELEAEEEDDDEVEQELQRVFVQRTLSGGSTRSSIDGITRSPEFHAGHHVICEYHKLPILSKGEGFIYGFRWNLTNKIHIV
ncbi:hypothetical protein L5515_005841 [Caenorhabditis briggsae]|uniref:Uncharacterized protein n=1 Tax=Caenorhabditis briggsae TaxID=6238 RepID=A0AAE9EXW0_CAEBR|nr:hypothetical protein L5515_005841 [Caenorhabditis briggsae]